MCNLTINSIVACYIFYQEAVMFSKIRTFVLFIVVSQFLSACGGGGSGTSFDRTLLRAGEVNSSTLENSARGTVRLQVYLPPNWDINRAKSYPLVFFLHGSGGNENSYFNTVLPSQLNRWINQNDIPPFVLVSLDSEKVNNVEQRWTTRNNAALFTSSATNELRAFSLQNFNAGNKTNTDNKVSIQGYSLGAQGVVFYASTAPDKFSSAVADAFVSPGGLQQGLDIALQNRQAIIDSGIKIRLSIGDQDLIERFTTVSEQTHDFLTENNIPHEYEVLTDTTHNFFSIWNANTSSGDINGLHELKLHASTWQ